MKSATNCKQAREYLLDLAEDQNSAPAEVRQHLSSCSICTAELESLKATMNLLDEWHAPEPSPYFDSRLQARLREVRESESSRPRGVLGWLGLRWQQATAFAMAAVLAVGIGWYQLDSRKKATVTSPAVADLQELDRDVDLYANFDLLDEAVDQN
jgi:anti-sigma factor RsiW